MKLSRSGALGVKDVDIANTFEEGTGRLKASTVYEPTHGLVQDSTYTQDDAGNVTSIFDKATVSGASAADYQCFTYDGQRRVAESWTPKTAGCASTGRTTANLGGPASYWKSYTYNAGGQRASETTHTSSATTDRTYCYDTSRKHALVATTTNANCTGVADQYTYDDSGNSTKRLRGPTTTTSQTLTWSGENKLSKLVEGTDTTSYLYDADGELLIRRNTSGETVLYAGATEVHLEGTKKWANRYYTLGGQRIAVRSNETGTSKVSFLAGDHHGTSSVAIDSGDEQTVSKRYTTPFGAPRGTAVGTWPDDKRFLGKTADTNTALTHIGAREYDPNTSQFLSVDPLLELGRHQTLNGYSYGANNPLAFSDPTGMGLDDGTGHTESTDPGSSQGRGVPRGSSTTAPPTANDIAAANNDNNVVESVITQVAQKYLPNPKDYAAWRSVYQASLPSASKTTIDDRIAMAANSCIGPGSFKCPAGMRNAFWDLDSLRMAQYGGGGRGAGRGKGPKPGKSGALPAGKKLREALECAVSNSFTPETLVLLADGTRKPIKDVKVGDRVLAADPKTGKTAAKQVIREISGEGKKDLTRLTIKTGDRLVTVTATDNHPFWVPELRKWIKAKELNPRQWLQTNTGARAQVTTLERWTETAKVYNLTVADLHTYYVMAGDISILVHNCGANIDGYLYRGLAKGHHGYDAATEGRSVPFGGNSSIDDHVGGNNTNSIYTSWSDDIETAEFWAQNLGEKFVEEGVIMRIRAEDIDPSRNIQIHDTEWDRGYYEDEHLIIGEIRAHEISFNFGKTWEAVR